MPNVFKYAPGATAPGTLKKGDFLIGNNTADYGGTYYTGITPVTGGYTIYQNKPTGGPAINYAINDAEMIQYTFLISNQSFATGPSALNWYNTQSDKVVVNMDYEPITTSGLVLNLDAGFTPSYPKGGTSWFNIGASGGNTFLYNSPSFNSSNGGSIVFDGVDDFATSSMVIPNNSNFTVSFWMNFQGSNSQTGIISTWSPLWSGLGISTSNYNNGGVWSLRSWTNDGAGGGMNWGVLDNLRNVWSYIVLTYSFSSKTQSGYINSIFQNSESYGSTITHSQLQIARGGQSGSDQLTYYPYSNSRISNLQVYNRVLSQSEILSNYQALFPRFLGQNIVTSGLVAYYDAGYVNSYPGSGTTWINVAGTPGATGTLINGTGYSSATGGFFIFDGTDDYVQFPYLSLPSQNHSISIWFNTSSQKTDMKLISFSTICHPLGIFQGKLRSCYNTCSLGSSNVNDGNWHMATVVATNGIARVYLDGSPSVQLTQSVISPAFPTGFFRIASVGGGLDGTTATNFFYEGNISDCFIYSRSISTEEILQNFNAQRSRYGI